MARLTEVSLLNGVKNANIYGHHDRKGLGIKIKTGQMIQKQKGKTSFLRRNDVDIGEWDGANSDRRGKKNKLEYLGSEPMLWSKNEFDNVMGGASAINSGFSAGGDFGSFRVQSIESSGKPNINGYNPSPFKLKLNKSVTQLGKPKKEKKIKIAKIK